MLGAAACGCRAPLLGRVRLVTPALVAACTAVAGSLIRIMMALEYGGINEGGSPCDILGHHASLHAKECYPVRLFECTSLFCLALSAFADAGYSRVLMSLDSRGTCFTSCRLNLKLAPPLAGCSILFVAAMMTGPEDHLIRHYAAHLGIFAFAFHLVACSFPRMAAAAQMHQGRRRRKEGESFSKVSIIIKTLIGFVYAWAAFLVLSHNTPGRSWHLAAGSGFWEWLAGLCVIVFHLTYCLDYSWEITFGDVWPSLAASRCQCRTCFLSAHASFADSESSPQAGGAFASCGVCSSAGVLQDGDSSGRETTPDEGDGLTSYDSFEKTPSIPGLDPGVAPGAHVGHKRYDVVYLSPHLDDVGYSCAALVAAQRAMGRRVLVISVFTGRGGSKGREQGEPENEYALLEDRTSEDVECMKLLGVDWRHADFPELVFRHGVANRTRCVSAFLARACCAAWFFSKGSKRALIHGLEQYIHRVVAETGCTELVGPAGIGHHPDHLLVHRACRQLRDTVQTSFYQDFPYRAYGPLREARLSSLRSRNLRPVEHRVPAGSSALALRKKAVLAYDSQLRPVFGSREQAEATLDAHPDEHLLVECCEAAVARRGGDVVLPRPTADRVVERRERVAFGAMLLDAVSSFLAILVSRGLLRSVISSHPACGLALLSMVRLYLAYTAGRGLRWLSVISAACSALALQLPADKLGTLSGQRDGALLVLCALFAVQAAVALLMAWLCAEACTHCTDDVGKRRLRVMVVSDYFPPEIHGISVHVANLVNALKADHDVEVFSPHGDRETGGRLCSIPNPFNADNRVAMFPSCRLIWRLLTVRYDAVHVVQPSQLNWYVMSLAWLVGQPTFSSFHIRQRLLKDYIHCCLVYHAFMYFMIVVCVWPCWLFSSSNAFLTNEHLHEQTLIGFGPSLAGCSQPERVALAPSSVDNKYFKPASPEAQAAARVEVRQAHGLAYDCAIWLVTGRVAPEKHLEHILDALAIHRKTWPEENVCLFVAGDGPSRAELEARARAEELPVVFLGMVDARALSALHQGVDAAISCCHVETFGLAILEALASGIPHVLPRAPVFKELYGDALDAWHYDVGDVHALCHAARRAMRPESRVELATLKAQSAFGPHLFWSWEVAAVEQTRQYLRAARFMRDNRREVMTLLRAALSAAAVATTCFVGARSVLPHVWEFMASRGAWQQATV